MGEKNLLKELLKEDQEPFLLKDYIIDRKRQLQKQSSSLLEPTAGARTTRSQRQGIIIQLSSRKPISKAHYFPINLCSSSSRRGACFLSNLHDSPDLRKSPLVKFPSPLPANKSPYSSKSSPLFLHVPALTSNMLLEAATRRIQRKRRRKNKPESKSSPGHGLFRSLIKRLTHRKSPETAVRSGADGGKVEEIVKNTNETAVGSGADGGKCIRCRSGSAIDDEVVNVLEREDTGGIDLVDLLLCSSPVSPFLPTALYGQNPTPGHHRHNGSPSPSPAISSPAQLIFQDNDQTVKFQAEDEDDEEEKEQNSPVSILDPPFEDDDDQGREEEEAAYDHESGYAFVQRATQQLLHKLDRFEKLAELDPLELEQRMVEQEEEEEHEYEQDDEDEDGEEKSETIDRRNMDGLMKEIFTKSCSFEELIQKPGIKRLLSDMITYEKEEVDQLNEQQLGSRRDQICYRSCDQEAAFSLALVQRVGKRLDSWKQVESNSIDTMVATDVKGERDRWNDHGCQIGDTVMEIELHMFSLLVEEFTREVLLG